MNQNIEKIVNTNDGHTIISNNKQYKSKLIFDSRPDFYKENKGYLYQHFYGVEIIFKNALLDNKKVMLMDFQNFQNGINFFTYFHFQKEGLYLKQLIFPQKF